MKSIFTIVSQTLPFTITKTTNNAYFSMSHRNRRQQTKIFFQTNETIFTYHIFKKLEFGGVRDFDSESGRAQSGEVRVDALAHEIVAQRRVALVHRRQYEWRTVLQKFTFSVLYKMSITNTQRFMRRQ